MTSNFKDLTTKTEGNSTPRKAKLHNGNQLCGRAGGRRVCGQMLCVATGLPRWLNDLGRVTQAARGCQAPASPVCRERREVARPGTSTVPGAESARENPPPSLCPEDSLPSAVWATGQLHNFPDSDSDSGKVPLVIQHSLSGAWCVTVQAALHTSVPPNLWDLHIAERHSELCYYEVIYKLGRRVFEQHFIHFEALGQ